MDPTAAALISGGLKAALDSAAGEAGRSAWNRFSVAVSRVFGHDSRIAESASEVTQRLNSQDSLDDSLELFADQLCRSRDFERALHMLQSHFPDVQQIHQIGANALGNVSNSISGNARVGTVIQAGHISDGIRIGRAAEE